MKSTKKCQRSFQNYRSTKKVNSMSDEELEELRRRRLSAMRRQASDEQKNNQAEEQADQEKQALLRSILSPEARQRLANLKMIKPDLVSQLELQLIQLAQQGRAPIPMGDEQLKKILAQLQARRRETTITRR
jgi:programmed cell death protein 5